jgi:2-dehydropantoate 2-reductase
MRILIYGAGAVGALLGGYLSLGGHEVTLLGRERLVEAVSRRGLHLRLASGEHVLDRVQAVSSVADAFANGAIYDWIAFTMKTYDVVPACFEIEQSLAGRGIPVVSFQNGIGSAASLRAAFGDAHVVSATLTTPASMPEPGLVIEERARGMAVAADSPAAQLVIESFRTTPLPVTEVLSEDSLVWSKLLLNLLANAVPAILDMPPGAVFADPALFQIEMEALREAIAIARMKNVRIVNLPGAPARTLVQASQWLPNAALQPLLRARVAQGRGAKMPSLQAALHAGQRRTEVAWLNGAVVSAADSLKRYAPVNHGLALTLSDIVAGRAPWESFRGQPQMLMAAVRAVRGPDNMS